MTYTVLIDKPGMVSCTVASLVGAGYGVSDNGTTVCPEVSILYWKDSWPGDVSPDSDRSNTATVENEIDDGDDDSAGGCFGGDVSTHQTTDVDAPTLPEETAKHEKVTAPRNT